MDSGVGRVRSASAQLNRITGNPVILGAWVQMLSSAVVLIRQYLSSFVGSSASRTVSVVRVCTGYTHEPRN